ncbi:Tbc1d8b [Symbiodinium pilosum]|uniref:Tbc1d8b protein n=1 Tax=Symbiodinium pilosum TaxID=2952 RepID=A0A812SGL4_SYMPI|nr:Tbc1d8b [Symbiodinium pilosum]
MADAEGSWAELKRGLGIDSGDSLDKVQDDVLEAFERWRRSAEGEHHGIKYRLKTMLFSRQPTRDRLTTAIRRGIPSTLRGTLWFLCSGGLSKRRQSPKSYEDLVREGHSAKNTVAARTIANDLPRTGCEENLISPLENVLLAYAVRNPVIGYCQSMNFIVATFLLYCSEEHAFWTLCSVIEEIMPEGYYTDDLSGLRSDLHVFNWCIEQYLPQLYQHFCRNAIDAAPIFMNWFLCLFVNTLPPEHAHRALDCALHEGHKALFRIGLAILALRQKELLGTSNVVEAYAFLRQPFGEDLQVPSDVLSFVDISSKQMLDAAYGPLFKNFRSAQIAKIREMCVARVKAEDAEAAARKKAWADQNAKIKEEPPSPASPASALPPKGKSGYLSAGPEELRSAAREELPEPPRSTPRAAQQRPEEVQSWLSFVRTGSAPEMSMDTLEEANSSAGSPMRKAVTAAPQAPPVITPVATPVAAAVVAPASVRRQVVVNHLPQKVIYPSPASHGPARVLFANVSQTNSGVKSVRISAPGLQVSSPRPVVVRHLPVARVVACSSGHSGPLTMGFPVPVSPSSSRTPVFHHLTQPAGFLIPPHGPSSLQVLRTRTR